MLDRFTDGEPIIRTFGWDECLACNGLGFFLYEEETVELPQGYRNVQTLRICGECSGSGRALEN
mgnify:FL=1